MAQEHRENYRVTATDETGRALASVRRGFEQVESAISTVGRAAAGLAGIAAAAMSVGAFARAASEAEQASNRLTAVIRATGGAAGKTKQELDAMADSMAESSIFDDEAIRNAQATLLKFGGIQGEVFNRGMALAADYASFTGGAIEDAAQTIGKALQSPEEGVGALERQIGKLDYTQKENIKTFMDQGRVMDAQKVILDALGKKIGGTSDLINSGLTKELANLKKNVGETFEALGKTGAVDTGLKVINSALKDIKNTVESGDWMSLLGDLFLIGRPVMGTKTPKQDLSKSSGMIGGGPGDPRLQARLAEINAQIEAARERQSKKKPAAGAKSTEMTLDELLAKGAIKRQQTIDQAQEDGEKSAENLRKEQERLRESVIDLIDPTAQYVRLLDVYRQAMADDVITTEQYTEAAFILNERIEEAMGNTKKIGEEAQKTDNFARDMGLTMSSAFEDAVLQGKELRDVLRGLAEDMARIVLRKTVTEPLGGAFTKLIGAGVASMFGGAAAGGGWVGAGDMDIPSFAGGGHTGGGARSGGLDGQGGFRALLHPNETVTDLTRGGAGGGNVYHIDARGADMGVVARIEHSLRQLAGPGVVERRAVAAVSDYRIRNGA